ncbi:MAG: hypothetical protein Q9211_007175, partial [Gyalolechia sp. 1 TL-2023]
AYHLNRNPRFTLVDYDITADRSASPAPPEKGRAQDTRNLKRIFGGVVAIDDQEHEIHGVGNGPISSLANALGTLGIDLDVVNYHQHSLGEKTKTPGEGRNVKSAAYIEATTATGIKGKVWGIGIHEDVVQASLIALLGAASSLISSRPNTPMPFRPQSRRNTQHPELKHLQVNGAPKSGPDAVSKLEALVSESKD